MQDDTSGLLWAIIDIGGIVILGAALAYGIFRNRNRHLSATEKTAQAEKTRELFREEDRTS